MKSVIIEALIFISYLLGLIRTEVSQEKTEVIITMEESLKNYLRHERKLPEENIRLLETDKIDMSIVPLMGEDELKKYVPYYGDRLAMKNFCVQSNKGKRESLLEKIRKKYASKHDLMENRKKEKSKVSKKDRIIDLGWQHKNKDSQCYRQVRTKQGGGTRSIKINLSSTKNDILSRAKDIFFPDGISEKGHISKFRCELWDFKCNLIDYDIDVSEMYTLSGLNRLRFYLSTEEKDLPRTVTSEESSSEHVDSQVETLLTRNDNEQDLSQNITTQSAYFSEQVDVRSTTYTPDVLDQYLLFKHTDYDLPESPPGNRVLPENMLLEPQILQPPLIMREQQKPTKVLILHRGNVFVEMKEIFKDINMDCIPEIQMILPNGQKEGGYDLGGIYRDALSEFWETFYSLYTLGAEYKIPYIRHDMKEEDWIAFSKVLIKGFRDVNYFPLKIAPVFIEFCIMGYCKSDILISFSKYIGSRDWEMIQTALHDFNSVDLDELIEVLQIMECKWTPTEENFRTLILDIAHKELIQKPMFVIDNWKKMLNNFISFEDLLKIYEKNKPIPKNILQSLEFSEENSVSTFLKRYIREANDDLLERLLRFCTGANMLTQRMITVNFNSSVDLYRAPVGHTCSYTLELSRNYNSFPEFRSEMDEVLKCNIWVMDIV
ncbi:unnamed protein product [Phaedon cochleariae]|uniref:HECT domain-containing protein n=1 Tax=Phaedon cochleariae TaxID=80249 RepID=A0A9N9SL43_PHACE|nr:unnamed protein product [Phaedon cochleariae]